MRLQPLRQLWTHLDRNRQRIRHSAVRCDFFALALGRSLDKICADAPGHVMRAAIMKE
ncbi:hypothetical protein RHIZ404_190198 [Rhizobium sp. EC-SD404]|nr:hypothetical protein RHIZ404_190198 [Rhizobium sp. EC-SD404]